jgi:HD-GYP domain-containing protein (c-di-GMP phosphodiesterase class II)
MISVSDAVTEVRRCSGSQFHPGVVRAFCELIERPGSLAPPAAETIEPTSRL